jgi:hypothetical protein
MVCLEHGGCAANFLISLSGDATRLFYLFIQQQQHSFDASSSKSKSDRLIRFFSSIVSHNGLTVTPEQRIDSKKLRYYR